MSSKAIRVVGIQGVQKALKDMGLTPRQSRTKINKVLQPAARIAERASKTKYKKESKNENPGERYDPSIGVKIQGASLSRAIGIITASKSRQPGLLVGPRVKGRWASANWSMAGKVNLAQLLTRGSKGLRYHKSGKSTGVLPAQPDYFKEVVQSKGNQILARAEKDIGNLIDRLARKAGFK
jgi:hypothetical protein